MLSVETGSVATWRLAGETWEATVVIDPSRWLGLEFTATDPDTGRVARHEIDTDLYDISDPRRRAFAEAIEADIVAFLQALARGEVFRARDGSRVVLAFTLDGAEVCIVQGRTMTRTSTRTGPRPVRDRDGFTPVR